MAKPKEKIAGENVADGESATLKESPKAVVKEDRKSKYTVAEFAAGAKQIFDTSREIVETALKVAGVSSCTVDEAKKLVSDFKKREVE